VITGTLSDMPQKVAADDIKPPTLIIVGTVVSLQKQLQWFQP
jgi:uroporphyrin-III C-methyltransferase/precorrin-2 dehydrogenase/sirohydrochlorin ferrochelatase